MRRLVVLIGSFAITICVASPANAQKSEPKPLPGRSVTAWQEEWDSLLTRLRVIYARNDSTAPIVITQMRLAKCANLRLMCEPFAPSTRVLAPGQTSRVVSVAAADPGKSFSFTFDLDWRTATECIGPRPAAIGEPGEGKTAPPSAAQMIIPPLDGLPASLRGRRADVTFYVAENGRVDSVGVRGISETGYLVRFRTTMLRYVFNPALDRGCPVRGVASIQMTF